MTRSTLLIIVVGLLVLLGAVLFSLHTSYLKTQVYLATYNPILALPVIDLAELETAVRALDSSTQLLRSYYTPDEFALIAEHLYPDSFLLSLVDTERARRTLITQPSLSQALTYQQYVARSLELYQSSLTPYHDIFSEHANFTAYFLDGRVNTTHLTRELSQLGQRIAHLAVLNNARLMCIFHTLQPGCFYPLSTNSLVADTPNLTPPQPEYLQFVRDEWSPLNPLHTTTVPNAACALQKKTTTYAWKNVLSRTNGLRSIKATTVDSLYFYDISLMSDVPAYDPLLQAGYLYEFQPTNPYMCLNFAYDIGQIALTAYFTEELTRNPLFTVAATAPELTQLAQLELTLVVSDAAHTYPVLAYLDAISTLLDTYDQLDIEALIGPASYNRVLEYRLIGLTNSVALLPTLGLIDDMMHTNLVMLEKNKMHLHFLFLARSYFPATLLFNNRTIVTIPFALQTDNSQATLSNFRLVSYSDIADQYSLEALKAILAQ